MDTTKIRIHNGGERFTDLTPSVAEFCTGRGDGLCHVFVPHATAGLAIMELRAGSEPDLSATIDRLLPRDDRYVHAHGSHGHGADHVLPALISPSLSLPVQSGTPLLGTWQSIVLVDTNQDNPDREVRLSFLAG